MSGLEPYHITGARGEALSYPRAKFHYTDQRMRDPDNALLPSSAEDDLRFLGQSDSSSPEIQRKERAFQWNRNSPQSSHGASARVNHPSSLSTSAEPATSESSSPSSRTYRPDASRRVKLKKRVVSPSKPAYMDQLGDSSPEVERKLYNAEVKWQQPESSPGTSPDSSPHIIRKNIPMKTVQVWPLPPTDDSASPGTSRKFPAVLPVPHSSVTRSIEGVGGLMEHEDDFYSAPDQSTALLPAARRRQGCWSNLTTKQKCAVIFLCTVVATASAIAIGLTIHCKTGNGGSALCQNIGIY